MTGKCHGTLLSLRGNLLLCDVAVHDDGLASPMPSRPLAGKLTLDRFLSSEPPTWRNGKVTLANLTATATAIRAVSADRLALRTSMVTGSLATSAAT